MLPPSSRIPTSSTPSKSLPHFCRVDKKDCLDLTPAKFNSAWNECSSVPSSNDSFQLPSSNLSSLFVGNCAPVFKSEFICSFSERHDYLFTFTPFTFYVTQKKNVKILAFTGGPSIIFVSISLLLANRCKWICGFEPRAWMFWHQHIDFSILCGILFFIFF